MKSFLLSLAFIVFLSPIYALAQTMSPVSRPTPRDMEVEAQREREAREKDKQDKVKIESDDDVIRVDTALVQIDATVTDKDGKIITNLKPEDFELLENGKPQKISFFSFVKSGSNTAGSPGGSGNGSKEKLAPAVNFPSGKISAEQVGRTIAIVLDDNCLSTESVINARRALKKLINEDVQANDLIGIFRTSGNNGLLQQFTTDKAVLNNVINNLSSLPSSRCKSEFDTIRNAQEGKSLENPDKEAAEKANTLSQQRIDDIRNELSTVSTLNTLEYIMHGLEKLPGRKSVFLLSDGLTLYSRAGDKSTDPRTGRGTDLVISDSDFAGNAMKKFISLANKAGIVFNTMDARSLMNPAYIGAADDIEGINKDGEGKVDEYVRSRRNYMFRSQDGMRFLAAQTGGRFWSNSNDLAKGLSKALDDMNGYYLLGYEPNAFTLKQDNTFQNISVRIKNPQYSVRHRFGFYGLVNPKKQNKPQTSANELYEALASPVASNGINIKLTPIFGNDPKIGNFIRFALYLEPQDLTFANEEGGKKRLMLDIAAVTLDSKGKVADEFNRTHTIHVSEEQAALLLKNGLTYTADIPIKKTGFYQLRVAIRDDNSQRIGAASQSIGIPNLKEKALTVNGLTLNGANPTQTLDAAFGKTKEEALAPVMASSNPAVRIFHPGMIMSYSFAVYNPPDKNNLVTQVKVYNDGKLFFEGPETALDISKPRANSFNDSGMIKIYPEMPAGNYVLEIIAKDKNNKKTASEWIDFEVIK